MFKYVLSLTFAVGLASAATISTSAECDGGTTSGTFSANCNHLGFEAQASLEASGTFSVFTEASLAAPNEPGDCCAVASANFSDDYYFTVFGGTGNGFFLPCFVGSSEGAASSATMSFAGLAFDITPLGNPTNCVSFPFFPINLTKSFTFGVPQTVDITMLGGSNYSSIPPFSSSVSESLDHIMFYDSAGNPLSNVTFTLVEVPEPSAWSMLTIGLIFLSGGIRCLSTFFLSH
jgi:hypothetical protein